MYEVYETDAYILSGSPRGEGDMFFHLYTKDFGQILVSAKNIRSEKSKLRFNLQPFSRAHISLVRGREYWRVVGARDAEHFFVLFAGRKEREALVRKLFDLISRLVHGEGANIELFRTLESLHKALVEIKKEDALRGIELVTLARLLHALGYFKKEGRFSFLREEAPIAPHDIECAQANEKELVLSINNAIKESQL